MENIKNFVVYKSSAGSGKTYTLVREYIALALSSTGYFRHILAVTFTNKAANEMKQRVVLSLLHLSQPDAFSETATIQHMMDDLASKTGFTKDEISLRAAGVLSSLLHDYDDFAVRTIDSFVSRIIRTFAHDLHLPVDFEIEMDKDVLLDEAISKLIDKAGMDPEVTRILVEFTETKAEDEKSWHIENDFSKVGGYLFSEDGFTNASKLREITPSKVLNIVREIKRHRSAFEESISSRAQAALQLISLFNLSVESFYYGKQGIGAFFRSLANGSITQPNSRVTTTIETDNWYAGKADLSEKAAIDSIKPQLLAIFMECENKLNSGIANYLLLGMISRQIYQLGVISAIEQELAVVKQERRVLHVSEFNKRITDIILKEPVPFIYERTGERFRNYLIDEFQDTSDLQWKNLLPLIANSLASGHFNLVVGDGKQAIYRFRNGQVEQFMLLPGLPPGYDPAVFGEAGIALLQNFKEELLISNYRSLPKIIEFNNDFFNFVSCKLDDSFKPIYENQAQKSIPGKSGGTVSIDFLENKSFAAFRELTLERILFIIKDLLERGYSLQDIVILTRSNLQGSTVARFLMNEGVNVISAEALLLAASPLVNLIIAALGLLKNPGDVISATTLFIQLKLSEKLPAGMEELIHFVKDGNYSCYFAEAGFDFIPSKLLDLSLYDLCEQIIRIFGIDGKPYDPYVQFFLEFVNKSTVSEAYQLPDLLDAWEEKKGQLSVIVPEGIDAVRIMTIHKAKGLEFRVVIWPFATESLKSTQDQIWVEPDHPALMGLPVALLQTSRELETVGYGDQYSTERNKSLLDMINLIYVAFTRSVERLYILTKEPPQSVTEAITLPGLIAEYLESTDNEWLCNSNNYLFGEKEFSRKENIVQKETPPGMDEFISASWQERIRIAHSAPHNWSAGHSSDIQEWGNLVHETLSRIKTTEDIPEVLSKIKEENQLEEVTVLALNRMLLAVVNHEMLSPYFTSSAEVKPEADIITPEGLLLRPDRVLLNGKEAVLMEFKTGRPLEWHARQINSYSSALERMGFESVRKLLVYIDEQINVEEI